MKITVRDSMARLEGDETVHTFPSGNVEIVTDDGKTLFGLTLEDDGMLSISAGQVCKIDGVILEDRMTVLPVASNVIRLKRPPYILQKKKKK